MTLSEPIARTRDRLTEMATELWHGKPGAYTLAVADRVPELLNEVERLTARVEEVDRNETSAIDDAIRNEEWADRLAAATAAHFGVDVGEHSNANDPWANALAAFGSAVDKAFAASPQVREWLANVKPPVGPGKPDDMAELRRRMDEATPGAVVELRAAVADRDERIAELERKLATANETVELMYQVRDRMAADIHAFRNPTSGDASVSIEMVGTVTVDRPLTGRCGICLKGVHQPVGEDWSHYAMPVPYHEIDGVTVNEPDAGGA